MDYIEQPRSSYSFNDTQYDLMTFLKFLEMATNENINELFDVEIQEHRIIIHGNENFIFELQQFFEYN